MSFTSVDKAIIRVAQPYGAVSHPMLRRAGVHPGQIVRRLATGFLIPLEHETYGVAGFPPTWQRQFKAAELSVPGAAISGLAAAKVHAFEDARVLRPELVVPYTKSVRNKLATVHRSQTAETTNRDGFCLTSVAQTLFDVRRRVNVLRLERWIDDALLAGKTSIEDLDGRRRAYNLSRVPGIGLWRALLAERLEDGWDPPESELEAQLWRAYEAIPGHPKATRQAPPWWPDGERLRFDIVVHAWRLILEADGRRWHARVGSFDTDRWRDNIAVAHGYAVQRFTHTHLTHRAAEVSGLIEQAGVARLAA